jgi:hypothetical protein
VRVGGRVAAIAALALAAPAGAANRTVELPSPLRRLTPAPPLRTDAAQFPEVRIPGPVDSRQTVTVGVDERGAPHSVRVRQELRVRATGDYSFVVPAPALDVQAPAGARAQPGLRRGAIVWQGFASGGRTLDATARLSVAAVRPYLPLAVSLSARVGGHPLRRGERRSGAVELTLALENRTTVAAESYTAGARPGSVASALDAARSALASDRPLEPVSVTINGEITPRRVYAAAPFRIVGAIVFGAGEIRSARVSGGRLDRGPVLRFQRLLASRLAVTLRGRALDLGAPRLLLRAVPVTQIPGLAPPGGSWRDAVRSGRVRSGRRLLDRAIRISLSLARVLQYRVFLLNPDASAGLDRNDAVYVYESSAPPRTPAIGERASSDGRTGEVVAMVLVGLLALVAATVIWAHL